MQWVPEARTQVALLPKVAFYGVQQHVILSWEYLDSGICTSEVWSGVAPAGNLNGAQYFPSFELYDHLVLEAGTKLPAASAGSLTLGYLLVEHFEDTCEWPVADADNPSQALGILPYDSLFSADSEVRVRLRHDVLVGGLTEAAEYILQ